MTTPSSGKNFLSSSPIPIPGSERPKPRRHSASNIPFKDITTVETLDEELIKYNKLTRTEIASIKMILFSQLRLDRNLFKISPLPDHLGQDKVDQAEQFTDSALYNRDQEIKEWIMMSYTSCYQRSPVFHPVLRVAYIELLTEHMKTKKRCYVLKSPPPSNAQTDRGNEAFSRPSPNIETMTCVRLGAGMTRKLLLYLTYIGMVFSVGQETEMMKEIDGVMPHVIALASSTHTADITNHSITKDC